jgi:hypothetical protein
MKLPTGRWDGGALIRPGELYTGQHLSLTMKSGQALGAGVSIPEGRPRGAQIDDLIDEVLSR